MSEKISLDSSVIIDLFCDFRVPYISSTRRKGLWS